MAITKRGNHLHLRFRPFPGQGEIGIALPVDTKTEARRIEQAILTACRFGDYRSLDNVSREVCLKMFRNRAWAVPPDLDGGIPIIPQEELTFWRAAKLFLEDPEVKAAPGRWRYEYSLVNLAEGLGRDTPLRSIWIPMLKKFQVERVSKGSAPATVNRDISCLSKLFGVMMEMELVERNPCRLLKPLSKKGSQRQVYLSFDFVSRIAEKCPQWFQRIIWCSYYSGMRRGEVVDLRRSQVDLQRRLITLTPMETKESGWKRIPIHQDLIPVLEEAMKIRAFGTDRVFLMQDQKGAKDIGKDSIKNPWRRACEALKLEPPLPRFHDLRHSWRANARRSGVDPTIAESILGHWTREKPVNELYGGISEQELLDVIDRMNFDCGPTEIWTASMPKRAEIGGAKKEAVRTKCVQKPRKKSKVTSSRELALCKIS